MRKIFILFAGLSLLPRCIMELLDSLNGWDLYCSIAGIIFSMYLIIASFVEKKMKWI